MQPTDHCVRSVFVSTDAKAVKGVMGMEILAITKGWSLLSITKGWGIRSITKGW